MALRFFNTMTRKIEEFVPLRAGEVSLYCCGPTVYNFPHIGNYAAYAFNDTLRRYLKFRGFKVKHVMNITDVDDKTIRDSRKAGKSLKEFTTYYTQLFLEDLKTLRIETPEVLPRATDEIPGMVEMIQILLEKGIAYRNEKGDIYFRISASENYGALAQLDRQKLRENAGGRLARADEYEKENAADFALWKAWDEADGDVFWETPIGKGRPGWHIECSVMSRRYLGQPFDIHCGGIDLIFPHHTNEIAQSEGAFGVPLARFWLHNAHLMVDGKKMAKREGNFYTLRDLLDKGIEPLAIRLELIKTHYRQGTDFRLQEIDQNARVLKKFRDFFGALHKAGTGSGLAEVENLAAEAKARFIEAMDDDLNISGGLAAIFGFMNNVNRDMAALNAANVQTVMTLMREFDSVVGVIDPEYREAEIPAEVLKLVAERQDARKQRDFKRADALRDQILTLGFEIKDSATGTTVTRKA